MNYRDYLRYFVLFGILFILVYFFTAIKPLDKEFFIQTERSIYLNDEGHLNELAHSNNNFSDQKAYPFRLKDYAGYFTESGEIVFAQKIPFKATLSDSLWAFYNNNSESIEIKTTDGSVVSTIQSAGFPFIQNDRIYLLPPGGNSISEYTVSGAEKWIYESYTPVTAFSSSKKGSVIGFADGSFVCLEPDGKERFAFYPGGSSHEIIFGAGISETENMTACLCGIDKQRFILASFDNAKHKIIFHEYLESDLHSRSLVQFSKDSNYVFYEYNGGLGIVDCKKLESIHIPLKGSIVQIEELENQKISLVLTKEKNTFFIYLIENSKNLMGSFPLEAQSAFITATPNGFFVGHDKTISKLNIERK